MADPAVLQALDKAGLVAEYHDPESTRKLVEREWETVSRLAKKLNLGK